VAGNSVEAQSYVRGKVDRITFGQDGIMLWIGKIRVPMSDVESVE
jgi:flagellar basal-body rod modification protein FlgD